MLTYVVDIELDKVLGSGHICLTNTFPKSVCPFCGLVVNLC